MKYLYGKIYLLIIVPLLFLAHTAYCAPELIYQYGKPPEYPIIDVVGLVDIEDIHSGPLNNCEQRIADIVIDEVAYDGSTDRVAGFRALKPAPHEWYGIFMINTDTAYNTLPNVDQGYILKLIKKGEQLIVTYQKCGSGGYVYVKDLYKKSAINNP